jgi:GNAT superfamily N-acetyltransferase
MAITIRPLAHSDRAGWEALWRGYQDFYEADLSADEDRLWQALMEPGPDGPYGLVAVDGEGALVGLAHYLFHITTWSQARRCYLNDLFTAPAARGKGAGRMLIEAAASASAARGAGQVWWLTQDTNEPARKLYDKVAKLTPFIKYAR